MSIVRSNLRRLDEFFAEQCDWIEWVRPRASTVGFPWLRPGLDADPFAAALVESERVLLLPGSIFGHPGNHLRLGFGRRDLPEARASLTRFAAGYTAASVSARGIRRPRRHMGITDPEGLNPAEGPAADAPPTEYPRARW